MHYFSSLPHDQQLKNSHINKCDGSSELCIENATAAGVAYFEIISQHNQRGNKEKTKPLWIFSDPALL